MTNKRPTGTHNPSASSLRRWDNEGGAPAGGRAKRPGDPNQLAKSIVNIATNVTKERDTLKRKPQPRAKAPKRSKTAK
jgi:hypothetical protein